MSTSGEKKESMENFSGWLVRALCEISPSILELENEIPERDMDRTSAAVLTAEADQAAADVPGVKPGQASANVLGVEAEQVSASFAGMDPEQFRTAASERKRERSNWKLVVAISGVAAACSAAVTGIVVFLCMRHAGSYNA